MWPGDRITSVYFTRNGVVLPRVGPVPDGPLYPHVALMSQGEKVQFDFGAVSPATSNFTPPPTIEGHGSMAVDASSLIAMCRGAGVSSVRGTAPLSPKLPYFEVTVVNGGRANDVGVGVSAAGYNMAKFPGACLWWGLTHARQHHPHYLLCTVLRRLAARVCGVPRRQW